MARTKASVGAKVSSGKSNKARCSVAPPPSGSGGAGSAERSRPSGGNSVCPRDTPHWQRPINSFFITRSKHSPAETHQPAAGSSKAKHKRNVIESDNEEDAQKNTELEETSKDTKLEETPKNTELDETIELEPLTGEYSHKIEEYYPQNGEKGKGVGKKSKDKENVNSNKREREETLEESVSKKVKI